MPQISDAKRHDSRQQDALLRIRRWIFWTHYAKVSFSGASCRPEDRHQQKRMN
jgi:hypothetical protein